MVMLTGKMTATWLVLLTVFACGVVPVILIYETTVRPYLILHHEIARLIAILPNLIPNVSVLNSISALHI